jgi:Lysyl oxidase
MGVDLKGDLANFKISRENFNDDDNCSIKYGCIEKKGNHRVLRFDMITSNIGDEDLIIGDPRDPNVQSKFFEPFDEECTEGLGYRFKAKPFFVYSLRNDDSSIKLSGYKDAFCFDGLPPWMDCDHQGLAAGGRSQDVYGSDMSCQFVVIDDLADGEYILEATVNAPSVDAVKKGKGQVFIKEDNYDNNTASVRLQIKGDDVTKLKQ